MTTDSNSEPPARRVRNGGSFSPLQSEPIGTRLSGGAAAGHGEVQRDGARKFLFTYPRRPGTVGGVRRAIYPGSFDPVTNGHLDVIQRAATLFDEVVVAVASNEQKRSLFSAEERVELIRGVAGAWPNIRVVSFDGLLVDFARTERATAVVRGLRAVSDFEFEFQMALMNRKLEPEIETIFLMPAEKYTYLSSRIIKEISRLGGDVSAFVPVSVVTALREKFASAPIEKGSL